LAKETEELSSSSVARKNLNVSISQKAFAKQVLAGKIVSIFKSDPNFTDIKFQKIQFLSEHIIEADLNLNYYYQAAGPYDNKFMHSIFDHLRKQQWYDRKNKQFFELAKTSKIEDYYLSYFAAADEKLQRLFQLMHPSTESEAEIIATVYAVWNNRVIKRQNSSIDLLIQDFYSWSERKLQYSEGEILKAYHWLRDNNFEPLGF
jgi:type I restriction enzyme S subunit